VLAAGYERVYRDLLDQAAGPPARRLLPVPAEAGR
jgi:hypothetical protein